MIRLIPLAVLLGLAALIAAFIFLPWWGSLLLLLALVFAGKLFVGKLLLLPFKAKGAALRNATASVESVERIEKPVTTGEDSDSDGESVAGPREYHRVVVKITPTAQNGAFRLWEPGELLLVSPEANPTDTDADDDELCEILSREVEDTEAPGFRRDEGMKYDSPLRLRLTLSTRPGATRLKFRYYFELFGDIRLQ